MRLYAVATISFFDNNLKIDFVEANNWKEALKEVDSNLVIETDDIEQAKSDAFDGDWMFEVKEIKL